MRQKRFYNPQAIAEAIRNKRSLADQHFKAADEFERLAKEAREKNIDWLWDDMLKKADKERTCGKLALGRIPGLLEKQRELATMQLPGMNFDNSVPA